MRPRPMSKGAPSTSTSGASPLDGAIASTRAPPDQRRPNRSSAAIAVVGQRHRVQQVDVVRAEAVHARPALGVGDQVDARAPAEAAALVVTGRRLHGHVEVELGQPAQLLGEHRGLPRPLSGQGHVRELAPAHATGAGRRPRGLDAVRATPPAPRRRRRARTSRSRPRRSAARGRARPGACAGRRRRDPRAVPRSDRRGRPGRSRARRARPMRRETVSVATRNGTPDRLLEPRLPLGRRQLPRHGRHDDARA